MQIDHMLCTSFAVPLCEIEEDSTEQFAASVDLAAKVTTQVARAEDQIWEEYLQPSYRSILIYKCYAM